MITSMSLNDYQNWAHETAVYPGQEHGYVNYPMTKLAGEVGEFLEKIGKIMRRDNKLNIRVQDLTEQERLALGKELGDVKWYAAELAGLLAFTDEEIAQMNLDKLSDRQTRGVIIGEGDDR